MDTQWRRLQPLLPPEKPWTGRPNVDHRRILNGISWVHRTGAPWRDLPGHYGPVGTVSSRFYRWRAAGIWDQVLIALQAEADARGEVDWNLHFVDATMIPAANASRFGEPISTRLARAGTRLSGMGQMSRRWAAARAGSRPSYICGLKAAASRWSPC